MRFATAVRWTSSHWFLPALFAVTCVVAVQNTWRTGYPAGDLASASTGLVIGGPLVSAFVAWKFRGFARLVRPLRSRRPGTATVLGAWSPLLLGAPATVCCAVMVSAGQVPDDVPAWSLVLVCFVTTLACALVGLALTWALPAVVAIPVAALGWFFWLAWTGASDSPLLHNLNSTFTACCSPSTRPAPVAVLASLTLVGVVSSGVLLLVAPSRWFVRPRSVVAVAVAAILLLGFGSGAVVARSSADPLQLVPVEPRTTSLVCRTATQVQVCLWPENEQRAAELGEIVDRVNARLGLWHLRRIDLLAEARRESRAVGVVAAEHLTNADLRYSVAAGYVDHLAGCPSSGVSRDERVALVALAAGLTESDLEGRVDPTAATVAAKQLADARTAPSSVRAWFVGALDPTQCDRDR